MARARIRTRDEFIAYIMQTLGHPIITVNVTEEQVNYRIDDALIRFYEFHNDGTYRAYLLHEYTQQDKYNGFIKLPEAVHAVTKIFPDDGLFADSRNLAAMSWSQSLGKLMFNGSGVGGQSVGGFGGFFPSLGGGMLGSSSFNYGAASTNTLIQSYAGTVTGTVSGNNQFQYSPFDNRLYIDDKNPNTQLGKRILVECFVTVDEDNQPIWDDIWLREYTVALVKKQWGQNLIKFGNTQLANGTTINGEVILNEAKDELQRLEEDLMNKWSEPLGVLMG